MYEKATSCVICTLYLSNISLQGINDKDLKSIDCHVSIHNYSLKN